MAVTLRWGGGCPPLCVAYQSTTNLVRASTEWAGVQTVRAGQAVPPTSAFPEQRGLNGLNGASTGRKRAK
jgi:hypothetical protein